MLELREAAASDADFLLRVLALAADWRPGVAPRSVDELLAKQDLAHYAPSWESGDRGLIAHRHGSSLGATWWHYFTPQDPGYGFVAADIPEVTVGVEETHRGEGVGTALLRNLAAMARLAGLPGLSLSVEPDNPAVRLYERQGFVAVGSSGGSVTMLLDLTRE